MKKYTALPTWFMTICMLPFVKADHPWRQRKFFTLHQWALGRTTFTKCIDLVLWVAIMDATMLAVRFYRGA